MTDSLTLSTTYQRTAQNNVKMRPKSIKIARMIVRIDQLIKDFNSPGATRAMPQNQLVDDND